jgi:hypothetical protein
MPYLKGIDMFLEIDQLQAYHSIFLGDTDVQLIGTTPSPSIFARILTMICRKLSPPSPPNKDKRTGLRSSFVSLISVSIRRRPRLRVIRYS